MTRDGASLCVGCIVITYHESINWEWVLLGGYFSGKGVNNAFNGRN